MPLLHYSVLPGSYYMTETNQYDGTKDDETNSIASSIV